MPQWVIWVIIGLLLVVMFVLPMFTRKKQQTQVNTMLSSISVGDKIKTVGGIIGVVIKVEQVSPVDKEFVIETGDENKSEMRFDINAVYQIISKVNAPAGEPAPFEENTSDAANAEDVKTEEIDTKVEIKEEAKLEPENVEFVSDSVTGEIKPLTVITEEKTDTTKFDIAPKSVNKKITTKTGAAKSNTGTGKGSTKSK